MRFWKIKFSKTRRKKVKNTNKKGFTIVELVIVIAVVAILAAVLIPTFAGIIEQANLSNDKQMVVMMNKALAIEFPGSKPTLAGDAVNGLNANGFYGDKFDTYTDGYNFAYDLKQNKMYLLDKSNKPMYPDDKANAADLWGLYGDNKNDYIDGITNYVATVNIANKTEFDEAFTGAGYVIDLNKGVMAIDAANKANIKLINGKTIVAGFDASGDANVMEAAETVKNANSNEPTILSGDAETVLTLNNQVIAAPADAKKNIVHVAAPEIIIKDCVITTRLVINGEYGRNITKVTVENCTFVGTPSGVFALDIQSIKDCEIIVKNNEFINCDRGVMLNTSSNITATIENNTFDLNTNSGKNVAIQLANTPDCTFTISNNIINRGKAFVRVHDEAVGRVEVSDVTFSGNTIADGIQKVFSEGTEEGDHKALIEAFEAAVK